MTPALKAMVEAMAAEVARQVEAGDVAMTLGDRDVPGDPQWISMEDIDLEKVARAGLEAIQAEPRDDLALDLFPGLSRKRWRGAIDAILKETP